MITIHINGESREVPEALTLKQLLELLKLPADRLAVELNRQIVPRGEWDAMPIRPDDNLEVVHFVGGGSGADGPPPRVLP